MDIKEKAAGANGGFSDCRVQQSGEQRDHITPDAGGKAPSPREPSNAEIMPAPLARRGAAGGTSQAAARSIKGVSSTMCRHLLEAMRDGPLSPEDAVKALKARGIDIALMTARARLADLHRAGFVRDSGLRFLSASSRKVVAWELAPAGGTRTGPRRFSISIDPAVAVSFSNRLSGGDQVRFLQAALVGKLDDLVTEWPALLTRYSGAVDDQWGAG